MKELIRKIKAAPVQVKASAFFLICSILSRGIAVITTPIFTRIMSTAEYGRFSVYNSWVSILSCFITLNLYGGVYTQSLVKFSEEKSKYKSAFQGLTLFLCIIYTGIYVLLHEYINRLLGYSTVEMLFMLSIIWTSAVYQLWAAAQRIEYKYRLMAVISISSTILSATIGILLVRNMDNKVLGRIIGWGVTQICLYSWLFFYDTNKVFALFSKKIWKYAIRLAVPLIPHYLSTIILNSADRIMISKLVDESSAGIYSLAYSLSLIMTIFNSSLLSTMEPWLYKQINDGSFDKIRKVAYPSFAGIALLNVLLVAFAPEIVGIFAPREYYDAIYVIPPVAMSVYFMFMYAFFATFEFYYEKTKYITIATVSGAVTNIITNYIFIKLFGYVAAGYTTLLCFMIFAVMHYMFMRKITNERLNGVKIYSLKILLGITAAFMLIGFVLMALYSNSVLRYSVIIGCVALMICFRKNIKGYFDYILFAVRKEDNLQ